MRKQWLVLLMAVLASAILWGCGSSGGSGGSEVTGETSVAGAENVGNCTICHTLDTHTFLDGIAGVNLDSSGLGSAITHDCEACHGGGQYHHGDGPIPYPSPDLARCEVCHEDQASRVLASSHNGGDAENVEAIAESHDSRICMRCHTAEGFMALKDITGTETEIEDAFDVATNIPENLDAEGNHILHNPVCGACHNPLTKEMIVAPAWAPNGSTSTQLATCTACHNYKTDGAGANIFATGGSYDISTDLGADGELGGGDDTVASVATAQIGHHDTSWYRTVATTHYDNPGSPDVIEGYIIRENSDSPCFDCHGHELYTNTRYADTTDATRDATSTIHTQWAQSGHAGELLKAKYAVARTDGVNNSNSTTLVESILATGTTHDQFIHGGWSTSCQRCHTSTGFSNFADDPTGYDPADNDFSHFASGTQDGSQNEMIYCWACHSDVEEGVLRNPGAITEEYDPAVIVSYPDIEGSNVCMGCHLGRETGEVVKETVDADGVRSFINSHYFSAGGQLFGTTGYEYDGQDYANVTYFAHDKIGTADEPGTGESGPCVACHMSGEKSHAFLPVEKDDDTGEITAITATVCIECHDGGHGPAFVAQGGDSAAVTAAAEFLIAEEEEYVAALNTLATALESKGIYFDSSSYPYFFDSADTATRASYTTWGAAYGVDEWQNVMGAAFNLNLLEHDPGGYAHNRFYVKTLIWDSIDYIYDGIIDGSVVADIQALEAATLLSVEDSAAAQTYLGTIRPGTGSR